MPPPFFKYASRQYHLGMRYTSVAWYNALLPWLILAASMFFGVIYSLWSAVSKGKYRPGYHTIVLRYRYPFAFHFVTALALGLMVICINWAYGNYARPWAASTLERALSVAFIPVTSITAGYIAFLAAFLRSDGDEQTYRAPLSPVASSAPKTDFSDLGFRAYLRKRQIPEQYMNPYLEAAKAFVAAYGEQPFLQLGEAQRDAYLAQSQQQGADEKHLRNLTLVCDATIAYAAELRQAAAASETPEPTAATEHPAEEPAALVSEMPKPLKLLEQGLEAIEQNPRVAAAIAGGVALLLLVTMC